MEYFKKDDDPSLQNWLGQTIRIGSWVYRSARDGNTTTARVGKVTKIHDSGKVTVEYHAEHEHRATFGKVVTGIPHVNTVVLIDLTTFTPDVQADITK